MTTTVRFARPTDAPQLLAIYAPAILDNATSFETELPSLETFAGRIDAILTWAPWLVVEREGIVLGYAYATRFRDRAAYRWVVETTVYVDPTQQRHGVGRQLYHTMLGCLRQQGFRAAMAGRDFFCGEGYFASTLLSASLSARIVRSVVIALTWRGRR